MPNSPSTPGLASGRLSPQDYAAAFSDLHPRLEDHEARVAADRCYFCHDAPCVTACPTAIDIPLFIRQIATDLPEAAGMTIFESNILGGMCARVCPTETLCEEACVRETAEGEPVKIGELQRYATDQVMAHNAHPFTRAAATGKRIAVVGAGPAGLACAHRLAMKGHEAVIYEARPKPGGLNEYGIAAYKSVDDFAAREADWVLGVGGITLKTGETLGEGLSLDDLNASYDAVFLGVGLSGVNALTLEGEGGEDAVEFIAALRQASDLSTLPVGRRVVVVGGGMTAVDAAVQAKLLGAEEVSLVYRRGRERMKASGFEQDLAACKGVRLIFNSRPVRLIGNGSLRAVEFARTTPDGEESFMLEADQFLRAIGQSLTFAAGGLDIEGGKIVVDKEGRTSLPGVWAGGDCVAGGDDLTVTAVAEGRDAAESINRALMGGDHG